MMHIIVDCSSLSHAQSTFLLLAVFITKDTELLGRMSPFRLVLIQMLRVPTVLKFYFLAFDHMYFDSLELTIFFLCSSLVDGFREPVGSWADHNTLIWARPMITLSISVLLALIY